MLHLLSALMGTVIALILVFFKNRKQQPLPPLNQELKVKQEVRENLTAGELVKFLDERRSGPK